jgi:hypothetical protein
MPLSPADFYAYSRATGAPVADTAEERAQQAPEVLAFQQNRLQSSKQGPGLLDFLGGAALLAGVGAGGYGIARALRGRAAAPVVGKVIVQETTPQAVQNVRRAAAAAVTDPWGQGNVPKPPSSRYIPSAPWYSETQNVPAVKPSTVDLSRQSATLVEKQDAQRVLNVDQSLNAINTAEDQMTGRMKSALQRNPELDMSQVEVLEDMAEYSYQQGMEQDEPINRAATQILGRVPTDQAEGLDLSTGQRFVLNTTRPTQTGLGPGQRIELEDQPISATGFVKDFISKQRGDITDELQQKGMLVTPGRVEKEVAARLGPASYEYGSEFTKTKQAMEVGLEDPRYLQASSLAEMPKTRMVSGTEFNVDVKDVMENEPELAFRKPFISAVTAISSEEDFVSKQNEIKDWLGNVRVEVAPKINQLTKQQNALSEQQNMLLYSLNQKPDRELGQQLRNVSSQMQRNESDLNFLNKRLTGATTAANQQLEELSKWTPSTLVDWSGEGTVVRPKRTAPDTMSFESEGGELSNIERGASMAQPGPEDLEIVPGGLLSGGRARVVSNIGQDIGFDPQTGQRLLVPLVDADTGEGIIQKFAGKRMGQDIGVRGRGGSAGMDTNASVGIYGTERGPYGTAAQTKTGLYTPEASQVPSLVNSEPTPKPKSGGFFTYPQQREANPAKYAKTPTPQGQESFDVARQLRQLQLTGKPGEAQSFLDKIMKQRGVSGAGGTFSILK